MACPVEYRAEDGRPQRPAPSPDCDPRLTVDAFYRSSVGFGCLGRRVPRLLPDEVAQRVELLVSELLEARHPTLTQRAVSHDVHERFARQWDRQGAQIRRDSARTGKDLWSFFCGVAVTGVPIAYRVGDKQYITITSGPLGGCVGRFRVDLRALGLGPAHPSATTVDVRSGCKRETAADAATSPRNPARCPGVSCGRRQGCRGCAGVFAFRLSAPLHPAEGARDSAAQAPKPN